MPPLTAYKLSKLLWQSVSAVPREEINDIFISVVSVHNITLQVRRIILSVSLFDRLPVFGMMYPYSLTLIGLRNLLQM
jgi:hypothetical protein